MDNPFVKKDNTALITLVALGAVTAGTLAYLFLTESGEDTRKAIKHKLTDEAKDIASAIVSKKTGIKKKHLKKAADLIVK